MFHSIQNVVIKRLAVLEGTIGIVNSQWRAKGPLVEFLNVVPDITYSFIRLLFDSTK